MVYEIGFFFFVFDVFAVPEASPTKAAGDTRLQCLLGHGV